MHLLYNIDFGIASIIFLTVLLIYLRFDFSSKNRINHAFFSILYCLILANVFDVITAISISYSSMIPSLFNLILNEFYFAILGAIGYHFIRYAYILIHRDLNQSILHFLSKLILLFYFIVLAINFSTGILISFDANGNYIHGPLYAIVFIIPYFFVTLAIILVMLKGKPFNTCNKKLLVFLYLIIGISCTILQVFFFPTVLLCLFGVSIGSVLLLFSLENSTEEKLLRANELLTEASAQVETVQNKIKIDNQLMLELTNYIIQEFQSPLHISSQCSNFILDESNNISVIEHASKIKNSNQVMSSFINDLRDYISIDDQSVFIDDSPYNLENILFELSAYTQAKLEDTSLLFDFHIASDIPKYLSGDSTRLLQIMNNLIAYSIKNTQAGFVSIDIRWEITDEYSGTLRYSVSASSHSISEMDIQTMQLNLAQIMSRDLNSLQELGINLIIVSYLTDLMKGNLVIQNSFGNIISYTVSIPQTVTKPGQIGKIEEDIIHPLASILATSFHTKDTTILVIDNQQENLDLFYHILQDTDSTVHTASNEEDSLQKIKENQYDLIFLDYHMPDIDGVHLLREIKKTIPQFHTPVILTNSRNVSGDTIRFIHAGFDGVVSKPYDKAELLSTLKEFLPKEKIIENES